MQICSVCAASQLDGTIFCAACGAAMGLARAAPCASSGALVAHVPWAAAGATAQGDAAPEPFCLYVIPSGTLLRCAGRPHLIVGRRSAAAERGVDIDLQPMAAAAGVSRRHALLRWERGRYVISDLGSTNGTAVNGRAVRPEEPTPLRDGDELRLGFLTVQFLAAP